MFKIPGLKKLFVAAVLIRLLVIPFYFHPDIKTTHFQASFLKQGIVDIYSHLEENKETLPLKEEFVYFPLTYFFLGGYQILAEPFLGAGFYDWLSDASQSANEQAGVFRYLFILKLPYLLLDIAIGFLLMKFFQKESDKKKVFVFWMLNPFSLALIYAFSNLDVIVVFLTVLSLLLVQKNKLGMAALMLGIGAGFKAYPLLFVPFLLLAVNSWKQRVQVLGISLLTFGVIVAPFLKSESFREATLTSGLMTRLTLMGVNLGFNETLLVGVMALAALFFWGILEVRISKDKLWKYYLALLVLLFSVIHFHIQWILWVMPFAALLFVYSKKLVPVLILLLVAAISIPLFYEDRAMTVGLFSTISPWYNLLPIPFAALQKVYDPYVVQSILHSVFAGGSLVFIWRLFNERQL